MADNNHVQETRIKFEPDLDDDFDAQPDYDFTEGESLPTLPPNTMYNQDELNAQFDEEAADEDLANMLTEFDNNSRAQGSQTFETEYNDALAAFQQKQSDIEMKESLGDVVTADKIELRVLEEDLLQAQKRRDKLQAYEKQQMEDNSMFFGEGYTSNEEDIPMNRPPSRGEATNVSVERSDVYISDDDGSTPRSHPKGKKSQSGKTKNTRKTSTSGSKTRVTKRAQPARRGGRQNANMLNFGSLLRNDVVANARANQGLPEQPGFRGETRKKDALAALIASIPKESRDTGYGMKTKFDKACRQFKWRGPGSMKADGIGGWGLKGVTTSLKHFQLLSTAWGVERERGLSSPFGGLLADEMGYGKTLQMITVMVENQPKPNAKNRTTLIVVPSSILRQWVDEIATHTDDGIMENVCVYKSSSGIESVDVCRSLQQYQVVITTYHQVMANYPKCVPPLHITTEKGKDEWWEKYYLENRGPLLRMPFFRVILDEAQMIKNHESRTSKACRLLTAKYKWVLTGTPLSNCMEELFPYFHFLGVDGSSSFEQFKHNYAKRNDRSTQRLDAILRKVMVRRTGADRLFGAPLVSLPALDHATVSVSFNPVEKVIYAVVRQRFIDRINDWTASGKLNRLSRNIFVMLTRLRQMCAHVLMVTTTIRDLLEVEDVEKLWKLMDRYAQSSSNVSGTKTAKVLKKILHEARDEKQAAPITVDDNETIDLTISDADFDYRGLFYRFQGDGTWEKIRNRSTCYKCREVPESAKLSVPCGHLYCDVCIRTLLESAELLNTDAECISCHNLITGEADLSAMEQIAAEAHEKDHCWAYCSEPDSGKKKKKRKQDPNLKWLSLPDCEKLSSKVQAITDTMEKWIAKDPEAKIVVFTLFIPMVKVMAKVCVKRGWGYQEYTGQLSTTARNKNLDKWKDPTEDCQVLLMSMRAGGLGLNLVQASYVIIVDPWWNEPMEDQAFSRIYRIGQKRDCVVRRFVINDAIDTQLMLHLQKLKALECNRVVDGRPNNELNIHDLLKLFGPTERDPETGHIIVKPGNDSDGLDEFVQSEDPVIVDDSDVEETMPAPARPQDT